MNNGNDETPFTWEARARAHAQSLMLEGYVGRPLQRYRMTPSYLNWPARVTAAASGTLPSTLLSVQVADGNSV